MLSCCSACGTATMFPVFSENEWEDHTQMMSLQAAQRAGGGSNSSKRQQYRGQ